MTDPANIVERLNEVREEGVHMLGVLANSRAKLGACSEIAGWISDARIQLSEAAPLIEAQQAEIANLNMALAFVHRWTWEKEGNGTSDAERLDVIKHHPMIAALQTQTPPTTTAEGAPDQVASTGVDYSQG